MAHEPLNTIMPQQHSIA